LRVDRMGAGSVNDLTEESLRSFVLRIGEKLRGSVFFNNFSAVHEDDPIRDLPGKSHLVGDKAWSFRLGRVGPSYRALHEPSPDRVQR
jgi:hypothetical protein